MSQVAEQVQTETQAVQVSEPQSKFILPSGKELRLNDVLRFCYGMCETDIQVLMTLLRSSPKPADELAQELQLSKATVNRVLSKLLNLGFVKRVKETGNKAGRPRYVYSLISLDELKNKLVKDLEECANSMRNLVMKTNLSTPNS
ncbi:MAG: MarR family transcriptional regulator [Thermoprotei archaeon]|nr:MarR family transcriptional regulator [Thermoprotei archaeon]